MTKRIFCFIANLAAVLLLLSSCKPQVPGEYLQPDEMEDILYDYHLASGMIGEDDDSSAVKKAMYEASVLRKHGVSEARFDASLLYYSRHSDRFHDIYANLQKRLNDEAVSLGASAGELANMGGSMAKGDTANIWKDAASAVLATCQPYNVKSFYVKVDSAFHKGDRVILSFKTQFIFQDGYKDGMAMLAVRFQNDSVASQTVHLSESSAYSIAVADDQRVGIKEIRGFITLQSSPDETQTTLKLMFVGNLRLVRCHVAENAAGAPAPATDSLASEKSAEPSQQPSAPVPTREMRIEDGKPLEMKPVDK